MMFSRATVPTNGNGQGVGSSQVMRVNWVGAPLVSTSLSAPGIAPLRPKEESRNRPDEPSTTPPSAPAPSLRASSPRERSRSPYTVYKEIVKPEVVDREADRFLFYDKCLGCHRVGEITGHPAADWRSRIILERQRRNLDLTDGEAERISRYLQEAYDQ